jgi:stringent starvation protein B
MSDISTKPYMIRAIYEWCTDNGFTPYVSVKVDSTVTVPMEFVRKGEIILNISFGATSALKMDNHAISFKARFGGVSRDLFIPTHNVQAIFANENGQGMIFDMVESLVDESAIADSAESRKPQLGLISKTDSADGRDVNERDTVSEENPKKFEKPSLKIIK